MTESFRGDNVFQGQNHDDDGLVEVMFKDGDSVILEEVEVLPTSKLVNGARIAYDQLVSAEGFIFDSYTTSENKEILHLGNELEPTLSEEGLIALQSKRHGDDLGFLAIAALLGNSDKLKRDIHSRFLEDSNDFPVDLSRLIADKGYDLWARLEHRRKRKSVPQKTIIAKLACIASANDHITMVPFVYNYDKSQIVYIPEKLRFGTPWLYLASENDNDIVED
jgi:hypothetical protein